MGLEVPTLVYSGHSILWCSGVDCLRSVMLSVSSFLPQWILGQRLHSEAFLRSMVVLLRSRSLWQILQSAVSPSVVFA